MALSMVCAACGSTGAVDQGVHVQSSRSLSTAQRVPTPTEMYLEMNAALRSRPDQLVRVTQVTTSDLGLSARTETYFDPPTGRIRQDIRMGNDPMISVWLDGSDRVVVRTDTWRDATVEWNPPCPDRPYLIDAIEPCSIGTDRTAVVKRDGEGAASVLTTELIPAGELSTEYDVSYERMLEIGPDHLPTGATERFGDPSRPFLSIVTSSEFTVEFTDRVVGDDGIFDPPI